MSYWTLEPHGKYSIAGFYHADGKTYSPISAISEEESRKKVGQLGGRLAGLVELHVMRSSPLAGEMPLGLIAARGQSSLRAAVVPYQEPQQPPHTWEQLRQQIAAQAAAIKPRGLMAPSGDTGGQLRTRSSPAPSTPTRWSSATGRRTRSKRNPARAEPVAACYNGSTPTSGHPQCASTAGSSWTSSPSATLRGRCFAELFGLLVGLDKEWLAQGATAGRSR